MFKIATPESVGISSRQIYKYINALNERVHMHSVLMAKGDKIIYEGYWKPFNKDFNHRMYSVTKSFVSVAIGLLVEDGKISLDDKIISYFPDKISGDVGEFLKEQTIREMLTMTTVGLHKEWYNEGAYDRTEFYMKNAWGKRPSGTAWEYDSAGSQVLCALVERVSEKRLFDFLNERIFTHLGAFKNATILKAPNGDSWGDSALICTPRDLLSFARFVMNYGTYNGKRLMNDEYLREATSYKVDNSTNCHYTSKSLGYGYQFWRTVGNAFAFVGMGDQMAICFPNEDFIFVCTADNQGNDCSRDYIITQLYESIIKEISHTPLEENAEMQEKLAGLTRGLELFCVKRLKDSPIRALVHNQLYLLDENPMKIKQLVISIKNDGSGMILYNKNGKQIMLPFLINKNHFGKFPELGYSNEYGGVRTSDGFKYDCATSVTWTQENRLVIFSQVIDKYLGNLTMTLTFKGDLLYLTCEKYAEDFMWEYAGEAVGHRYVIKPEYEREGFESQEDYDKYLKNKGRIEKMLEESLASTERVLGYGSIRENRKRQLLLEELGIAWKRSKERSLGD